MNNINPTSLISFNGLIVKGTVPQKSVKTLGDFASRFENINFINDLEQNFEVDAVLNSDITKMTFSHKKYGSLLDYGCSWYPLENVFRDITTVIGDMKSAMKKAKKDFEKNIAEKELIKRGC